MAEPFTALVIYPTTKDAQTRQADNFIKLVAERSGPSRVSGAPASSCPRTARTR